MVGQFTGTWRFKSGGVLEIAPGWELADMNSSLACVPISQELLDKSLYSLELFVKCRVMISLFLRFFSSLASFDYLKHEFSSNLHGNV